MTARSHNRLEIYNESGARVNSALVARIGRSVLEYESVTAATINIILVDNAEITRLNEKYLQHPGPTDVIAFQYEKDSPDGDLFVSHEQVLLQAAEYNVSRNNELARLVIHGLLHLVGHSDSTPAQRSAMRRRENRYLKAITQLTTISNWIKN